jgi:antitoxin HicB
MKRSEPITTTEYTYTAAFEPAAEGGYVVRFPSLPDLITEGDTLEEARAMAADLLQSYLELLRERGHALPASDHASPQEPIRVPLTVKLRMA